MLSQKLFKFMKTLKTIVLLIVITITAPDAISQRAGIYKDIQFDSLYTLWSYTSYDPTIVGHEIDSGQQVLKEIIVDQKLKAIQIGALDAGVYNIIFYNGNNIHTEQLIVL